MRFRRNLSEWEIVDQALHFRRIEPIDHAVFMGMGEPMLNVDAVLAAARRLPDVGVTHRRTTISTVGWLPGLTRFVDEVEEPIRLAFSLHAPTDALRSELMPVNDRYPLEDVLAECRRYFALRRRKVFVEYVMLDHVNDSVAHARELAELLDARVFKVNLIPYNPTGMYDGASRERIAAFKHVLDARAPPVDGASDARPRHRRCVRAARGRSAGLAPDPGERRRGPATHRGAASRRGPRSCAARCSDRRPADDDVALDGGAGDERLDPTAASDRRRALVEERRTPRCAAPGAAAEANARGTRRPTTSGQS